MKEGSNLVEIRRNDVPVFVKDHYERFIGGTGYKYKIWFMSTMNNSLTFSGELEKSKIGASVLWKRDVNINVPISAIKVIFERIKEVSRQNNPDTYYRSQIVPDKKNYISF